MVATFNQANAVKGGDRRLLIDTDQALTQLRLLGYDDAETVYLREFAGKPAKHYPNVYPKKSQVTPATLPQYQSRDRGLYFVVNGQGQKKADVVTGRALFCEWDDRPIEDQLFLWERVGMFEPTLQIVTRKSVHTYWVLDEPIPVEQWQWLQIELLEWLKGDRALKDPSRVMRLAGGWHIGKDEDGNELEPVRCDIVHQSENRYSYEHLRDIIPRLSPIMEIPTQQETRDRAKSNQKRTQANGSDLLTILQNDILPRLSPESQFCWAGHNFRWSGQSKARGCCPWHESQSGTAFHIEPNGDGGKWLWECPSCGIGGDVVNYRHRLKGGNGSPRGKDWVDVVKELADDAGVTLPEFRGGGNYPPGGNGGDGGDGDNGGVPDRNRWNAPMSHNGEIGWWVKDETTDPETGETITTKKFIPQCNFDFQVERELSDDEGGGVVLQVKRSLDNHQRRVILKSLDVTKSYDFINALKKSYGALIVCNLKPSQITSLLQSRLMEYRDRGGELYRLANRHGQQENGDWVFSNIQFTKDGDVTAEEESKIVFNPNLGGDDKLPIPSIAAPSKDALPRLVKAMRRFHGESQIVQAILTLGWVTAGIHYQRIMQTEGRFPLLNLVGDPGGGKTILASNALSLVGWTGTKGTFSFITESKLYEILKHCGSLPTCFDDPKRSRELDELLKRLYNGVPRSVRGNDQTPHAPLMVTSNHACGDDQPATLSRLIPIPIYRATDGDASGWDELQEAQKLASGALPQLIKLGYPSLEIRAVANELRKHLPHAHQRVADSYGLITWYSMEVAKLGGFDPARVKDYVIDVLCKLANDADSASDSLTDFIDKLYSLKTTSKIGDWNIRLVDSKEIGHAIALHMPSVWSALDKEFHPPYSRRVVEALIDKAGGKLKAVQKFHTSEDESKTYRRLLLSPRTDSDGNVIPPIEPDYKPRRCVLLPASLASDFIDSWDSDSPPQNGDGGGGGNNPPSNDNDGGGDSVTSELHQLHPVTPQLHEKCNQQNIDSVSHSTISEESVTFFSDMASLEKKEESITDTTQNYTQEKTENVEASEKDVTGGVQTAETQTATNSHWLHNPCNQRVTECNQGEKDVTGEDEIANDEPYRRVTNPYQPPTPITVEDAIALLTDEFTHYVELAMIHETRAAELGTVLEKAANQGLCEHDSVKNEFRLNPNQ